MKGSQACSVYAMHAARSSQESRRPTSDVSRERDKQVPRALDREMANERCGYMWL